MKFPMGLTRLVSRQALKINKHSPAILFAAGITGGIGSTVLACKATLKLEDVLDEHKKVAIQIDEHAGTLPNYTVEDAQKDRLILTVQTARKVVVLYGPALILGSLSVAALATSHRILTQRNAAITAAYVAVDKAFKQYRQRVIDEYGEDRDRELRYGVQEVPDPSGKLSKDGNPKMVKRAGPVDGYSQFAVFFDESSRYWQSTPEYNYTFLYNIQQQANRRLAVRGHMFLNEIYDDLGLPRTQAGQVVGWIYDESSTGDGYIDLGFMDLKNERNRDFMNGIEPSVLLDFNVDGNIFDLI